MNQAFELYQNIDAGQLDRMNRMQAAILAKEQGLDPTEFAQPFPGNKSVTIHNHAPAATQAKPGVSKLAAFGIGLAAAAIPAVGVAAYLWHAAKPAVQTIEKVIQKPGLNYDVEVDMEVIPPAK